MVYPLKCLAREMNKLSILSSQIYVLLNHQWNAYLRIETYPLTFLRPKGRVEYFLINSGDSRAKFTPHSLISYHMKEQNCEALKLDYCAAFIMSDRQEVAQINTFIHFYNGQCAEAMFCH